MAFSDFDFESEDSKRMFEMKRKDDHNLPDLSKDGMAE